MGKSTSKSKYIMDDFKKFLSEQSDEQPYKILVFNHSEPTKMLKIHH